MLFFLISFLIVVEVKAEEWWQLPRTEDETYLYYVGISEGKKNSPHLQDQALNKAMGELIREHFGMSIQISESAVEELKGESYQVVTKQSSAPLFIKGVSQTKTHEKEMEEGFRIYVQIRVDKKSLAESVDRHLTNPGNEALNTYGESHDTKVNITVKTHPPGANIHFTHLDKRYSVQGQGDALFYLPRGRYQMVVSAPGFAISTDEFNIQANGREENVILDPIHTKLHLEVYPDDAKVEYMGKVQDDSDFKLHVAKPHRFKFSHPDYLSQEIELFYQYPETVNRTISLEPKTSTLRYEVDPHNALIEIDGIEANVIDGKIHVKPGSKNIRITKKGFFEYHENVFVNPNRDYPLKVIQLRSDDENTSPSDKKLSFRVDYNPFMYHEDRGRFALVPLAFHIEWHYVSLGIGYSWINEKDEAEETEKIQGSNQVMETDYSDVYGTFRLISPKFGPFKFYVSKTIGSVTKKERSWDDRVVTESTQNYEGTGGGFRIYFKPKWSMHAEFNRLNFEDKETKLKHSADRMQVGFSYEF
jgi:hypothetical protein